MRCLYGCLAYSREGCLQGGAWGGDSWRIGHPWHLGPFHSGPRSHLWDCVFNSASPGETRLPVATGLGVTPVVVGGWNGLWGRGGQGLLCTVSEKKLLMSKRLHVVTPWGWGDARVKKSPVTPVQVKGFKGVAGYSSGCSVFPFRTGGSEKQ